jgi:outer membrane protein TolC
MMTKRLLLLIFLVFLTRHGFSQEQLTMEEAIKTGLEQNYGVLIAKNQAEISRNDVTAGNAGMLPRIDLNGAYDKSITSAKVEVVTGSELDNPKAETDLVTAGVTLEWTLFDGLNMFITHDKLKKIEEIGEMEFKQAMERTITDIIINYVDIVRQQMKVNVLNEQVSLSQFRVQIAETKKNVGMGSEVEYLQAQVDLHADESALFDQNTALANSKTGLNEWLSRDIITDFSVMDTIMLLTPLDFPLLKQYTLTNNKDLLLFGMNKDVITLEKKSLGAQRYPIINFNAGYNYLKNESEASFIKYNRLLGPQFGISADINLFDGFNLQRQIQNAQISLLNADLQVKQTQNQLESNLVRLFNDYKNQLQQIDFEKKNIELAQKNMDVAKESYSVGAISPVQLRQVQENLIAASYRLIDALYGAKVKETELLLISGQLVK